MHPQQRDCNPQLPNEFAAWCWAGGIPDPSPVRPDPIPLIGPQLVGEVSKMLWEFGFRHHPEKQRRWIDGAAGLGMCAPVVKEPPEVNAVDRIAEDFLKQNNPKLLEAIKKAPPEEKAKLISELEGSFEAIKDLIEKLKES